MYCVWEVSNHQHFKAAVRNVFKKLSVEKTCRKMLQRSQNPSYNHHNHTSKRKNTATKDPAALQSDATSHCLQFLVFTFTYTNNTAAFLLSLLPFLSKQGNNMFTLDFMLIMERNRFISSCNSQPVSTFVLNPLQKPGKLREENHKSLTFCFPWDQMQRSKEMHVAVT